MAAVSKIAEVEASTGSNPVLPDLAVLAEWLKAAVLKIVELRGSEGSNPSHRAYITERGETNGFLE